MPQCDYVILRDPVNTVLPSAQKPVKQIIAMAFARLQRLRETSGSHKVNNNCRSWKLHSPCFDVFIMRN